MLQARSGSKYPLLMLCKRCLSLTCTMVLLTKTVLFYWDLLDDRYQQSIKDNISGVKEIEDWADKISAVKPLYTLAAQRSRGRGRGSRRGRTASSTNSRIQVHRGSPATTALESRASTPYSSTSLNTGGSNSTSISYVDGLDEEGLELPPSTQTSLRRKQAVASLQNVY